MTLTSRKNASFKAESRMEGESKAESGMDLQNATNPKYDQQKSESNFQVHVPIFNDFHKNIIGKGGSTIRKIRTETSTQIDLPSENSEGDQITVTGTKANVENAVNQLQQIQNELASIVTVEESIPNKIHSQLIGNGGRLLRDISYQSGGAQIKFPKENCGSDTVVIRGPREEADKAAQLLQGLAKDKELSSHSKSVTARPELHRYLIGRGGTKIEKLRESHPEVRIMFPRPDDKDQESIILVGRKEEVQAVRKRSEQLISDLNETEEITTEVDPQYHRHFVARSASVLRDLQDACGGVMFSFPKQNCGISTVAVKGSKECVEAGKKRIAEIVDDLFEFGTVADGKLMVDYVPTVHKHFKMKAKHNCYVTNNNPAELHISTRACVKIAKKLTGEMKASHERLIKKGFTNIDRSELVVGLPVMYLNGNRCFFSRAVVHTVGDKESFVQFVDYGDQRLVTNDALFPLEKNLVVQEAALAVKCVLPRLSAVMDSSADTDSPAAGPEV